MEVSAFIDWFAVTHFGSAQVSMPQALPQEKSPTNAHNGYTVAYKYITGQTEMYNPDRPKMGRHYVYSGKVLELLQVRFGVERDTILRTHLVQSGRVSRLDFAIDIKMGEINLVQLWEHLERGTAKTLSSHSRTQTGGNGGDTVYVGSRKTRTKMVRVYDKAKEMGDFVSDWVRCELETRSNIAVNAAGIYQNNNYSPSAIMGMVRNILDFPDIREWRDVFTANPSKIPTGNNQATDREKWLITQVAPALAQAQLMNPDFLSVFMAHVEMELHKRLHE